MRSLEQFVQVRRSGGVRRYHTTPVVCEQTLAAHQWGVALIFMYIYPEMTLDGVLHALTHDAPELITGDTPAPAKRMSETIRVGLHDLERRLEDKWGIAVELHTLEQTAVRQADLLDLLWYCVEERRLGNQNVSEIFATGKEYLITSGVLLPRAEEILRHLEAEWEKI